MEHQSLELIEKIPNNWVIRAPTRDDAPAIANLMNIHLQKYAGRANYSDETVLATFNDAVFDVERDRRVVVDDKSTIIAYVAAKIRAPYLETEVTCWVHPIYESSQLYLNLMAWAEEQVRTNIDHVPHSAPPTILTECIGQDAATRTHLEQLDFEPSRSIYRMRIDLNNSLPQPIFPEHISLKTFAEVNDLPKLYRADDEIFRDHWDYVSQPEEAALQEWQHWIDSYANIDFAYWYLAMDGDEIAAMSLCLPYLIGQEDTGHVYSLGVREAWRRQGLALALLYHSFRELKAVGRTHVTLTVDAENVNNATRLYEKAGMHVFEQTLIWKKTLREGKYLHTQYLED